MEIKKEFQLFHSRNSTRIRLNVLLNIGHHSDINATVRYNLTHLSDADKCHSELKRIATYLNCYMLHISLYMGSVYKSNTVC